MCDKKHYDDLDGRVTALEHEVADLRKETSRGFSNISEQLTNMDTRLVEEKVKWGGLFRKVVEWTVKALLAIVIFAAGVNLLKTLPFLWGGSAA